MTALIACLFKNRTVAKAAVTDLQACGLAVDSIHIINKPSRTAGSAGTAADRVLASILQAGIPQGHATIYAERVCQGRSLVVVHPRFGFTASAVDALQLHNPIEVAMPEAETASAPAKSGIDWTSPTPLSSWLGWRVLLDNPTPLSDWMNRPALKPEPKSSATLEKIRKQSADPHPLSTKFGWKLLSDNPSPVSKWFGWNLLSDNAAPLSAKFGWKLSSNDPTPLSTKFGWPLLSKNSA